MTDRSQASQRAPIETTAGPHLFEPRMTTRRIMLDVLIGLTPVAAAAIWFFRLAAVLQIATCLATAAVTEALICRMRGRPISLRDGSASITALILAFSLPPRLPLYATIIGSLMAVALGKMAFGGLGHNVFNPAMVGRAFLMICFPVAMTSWVEPITVHATTAATPLAAAKFSGQFEDILPLLTGNVSGCVGETSALLIALGGLWILVRRAADWRLTAGMLAGVAALALGDQFLRGSAESFGCVKHLLSGSVLLGAFFIVTDPVSSPLSKKGRWLFGFLVGILTMVIRLFAGYPEGVMFAVLFCNAISPMLDRWTAPVPVGGKVEPS